MNLESQQTHRMDQMPLINASSSHNLCILSPLNLAKFEILIFYHANKKIRIFWVERRDKNTIKFYADFEIGCL